ncbi:TRAP-type C4-dicarboxylate transport system, substrate-binding protein [Bhargavaea ginsengi]|uniref:TRAP-type C4-dicarboxylate transport system, substrate-binding protein n=1 Tax=Bhargavaea ginsengi TaxID=426757 RepID=A0A1H6UEU6_9BACL|nr:TRAP transporter substrate-binding protein DctP [Bhargavaea ginsengi]SEI90923.1 TRAP-type C4-dicarboxylate transport system, substrate-binding protein [Bhargavaea ginsengi]
MFKLKKGVLLAATAAAVLMLGACGDSSAESEGSGGDEQETIKLKVADSFPTSNYLSSEGIVYYMDRVEELTDGQVEFEYYPAEQIGKANSYLDLTLSRTVDIGYTSYATDKLPLSEIATLPGAYSTAEEGSKIIWQLMKDYLIEEEYLPNDVRPIYAVAIPQYQLVTTKKPVTSLEDFKGLKTRVTGTMEYALDELGGSPVFMPATEAYTAMERGTVDGVTFPFTSFEPYQIESIAKHSTKGANLGSFTVIYSINEKLYQTLPENVKEAMAQAGDETVEYLSKFLDEKDNELAEKFSDKVEIYELSEEESAEWDTALEPVWDRWAESLEKRGINANEAIEKYRSIQEELN